MAKTAQFFEVCQWLSELEKDYPDVYRVVVSMIQHKLFCARKGLIP